MVVSGDSLSKIAKREYGNANDWKRIFEANKDILKDPDKIYPWRKPAKPAPAPAPAPAGVAVSTITVGKAIGADKKVTAAADSFDKGDTFYASFDTTGTGTATLKAKWTCSKDGQAAVVKEDSMTVSATGPATHEFHVAKPDGWPVGDYGVAVTVDDKPAGSKKFSVK